MVEIVVLSASRAAAYVPSGNEVCISIADPKSAPVQLSAGFAAVLRLSFTDIAAPSPLPFDKLFDERDAAAIVEFVERHSTVDRIVIHCVGGISRSPAVALAIADRHGWPTAALEQQFPLWNTWVRDRLVSVWRARSG